MPLLPEFRSYYRRLWHQVRIDLLRWGRQELIGVLVAVAILFFQIHYGLIPSSLTFAAVKSVGWPYLLLILIILLTAGLKAPVDLDNQRAEEIREQSLAAKRLQDAVNELNAAHKAQIEALTPKPKKYSAGDKTLVQKTLQLLGSGAWGPFQYLLERESEDEVELFSRFGAPTMSKISQAISQVPLIEKIQTQAPPLPTKNSWRISDRFRPPLEDFFDDWMKR